MRLAGRPHLPRKHDQRDEQHAYVTTDKERPDDPPNRDHDADLNLSEIATQACVVAQCKTRASTLTENANICFYEISRGGAARVAKCV